MVAFPTNIPSPPFAPPATVPTNIAVATPTRYSSFNEEDLTDLRLSGSFYPSTSATSKFNTNAATAGTTLLAADVTGGTVNVDLALTGTLGAGANAQMPTVAAIVAALPNPVVGLSYRLRIINESSANFAWTVTTNTGWTLTGTMSIAQNTWREFVVTLTSLTAATLQNVAVGTFS